MVHWLREMAVFGEGLAVIRHLGLAFFNVVMPAAHARAGGRHPADIPVIITYVLWGFPRLSIGGVEFSHLFATSAVLTAVVAISMQDTLGNLLGGLALQMDNSLEIGDWIEINDISGKVTDIQWRYTAILTRDGERVVIPNSHLMKNRYAVICNKRQGVPLQRRIVGFNVDLSVAPARVTAAVPTTSKLPASPTSALNPRPVPADGFRPRFRRYQLRYWLLDPGPDEATDSEVRRHILAALQREGIRLAVADQTIHLVEENKAHREEVRARELERRVGAISRIDLLPACPTTRSAELAHRLIAAPFAKGDTLFRQGAIAHWLYIIASGEAEAWWQPPDGGPQRLIDTRGPGSVFGELGLMTGAPRRSTVIAISDIEAYRLDKAGFEHIIRARPELAGRHIHHPQPAQCHFDDLEKGYARTNPAQNCPFVRSRRPAQEKNSSASDPHPAT